mmetsp:Transcript_28776/g.75614  ORF Transcript_28776/g.75614 Transcript_28776/m.75614 type:complete len:150 (-) Transcript_28776:178-627(-)
MGDRWYKLRHNPTVLEVLEREHEKARVADAPAAAEAADGTGGRSSPDAPAPTLAYGTGSEDEAPVASSVARRDPRICPPFSTTDRTSYFYADGKDRVGPLRAPALAALTREGRVTGETRVWCKAMGDRWYKLRYNPTIQEVIDRHNAAT